MLNIMEVGGLGISWLYGKIGCVIKTTHQFCCLVRAQMCRTDNTFSLWLLRPAFIESQICKARGLTSTDVKWLA